MKKPINIAIVIFLFALLTFLFLKTNERQFEKVTIQTGLHAVQDFKVTGTIVGYGVSFTKWVQDKDEQAKSISFYADAATLDVIITKLKSLIKNHPNKNHGQQKKLAWVVDKNETETFLRLIHPMKDDRVKNKGC